MTINIKEWDDLLKRYDSLTPTEEEHLEEIIAEFDSTPEGKALNEALCALADVDEDLSKLDESS